MGDSLPSLMPRTRLSEGAGRIDRVAWAAGTCVEVHGGYGFIEEYPIARLYRDQKILEIGEGTNEVQRMVIAKQLGL